MLRTLGELACETDKELCTRCGMCAGVCPENCFSVDERNYPKLDHSKCIECGLCQEVCPGISFDLEFFSQKLFGKPYNIRSKLGFFNEAYVGYATDKHLRENATSGGIVTAILISLLEQKVIDGAIVTVPNKKQPKKFEPVIAKTKEELIQSAQAKYTVIPLNKTFKDLKRTKGKFALVGLPCHIHAFRKLSNTLPKLAGKVSLVIGLYCGRTMEHEATLSLIKLVGVPLAQIKEIKYRGGPWPGEFQVFTKDGKQHSCHKEIFMYFTHLYCPKQCLTCIDYSSEFSDISIADAWTREERKWKYAGGQSIILERTKTGREALQSAQKAGHIRIQKIHKQEAIRTHKGTSDLRKKGAIIRISKLAKRKKRFPHYGTPLPDVFWRYHLEELRRSSAMAMRHFFITRKLIENLAFRTVKELHKPQTKTKSKIKRVIYRGVSIFLRKWFKW